MELKAWISALRLRTLPLSLSCIGMGSFLAAAAGAFRWDVFVLCLITTVFLQLLSNLANDYGDSIHGADHALRMGPMRAVQSGIITASQMRVAVIVFTLLCLASGISLLLVALGLNLFALIFFLALGLLSIVAAVAYTNGRKPYGYVGLGDLAVFVFFGVVGVFGSCYLFTHQLSFRYLLPAFSCGFFSIGVLNINNIRDIDSDKAAGKFSIPVRLGRDRAVVYHWFLLAGGWVSAGVYALLSFRHPLQFLFLLSLPLFAVNGLAVARRPSSKLDPMLRQLAISTLLFVVLFGVGMVVIR